MRLVVGGHRPVLQTLGHEEPAAAVRLHDERVVAPDRVGTLGVVVGDVVRRLLLLEVRRVRARPLLLLLVPPDELLPLRPRLAVGIGRRAVVEQSPVGRPRPRPFEGGVVLLPVRLLACGLVLVLGVDAAVDPAAARRRPVRAQQLVRGERLAGGVAAVDLREHRLGARLLDLAGGRVVPLELEDRLVAVFLRLLQLLADLLPEVVVEPELGAAVLLRLDCLEVPLQQPLRVRERAVLLDVGRGGHEEDLGADLLR